MCFGSSGSATATFGGRGSDEKIFACPDFPISCGRPCRGRRLKRSTPGEGARVQPDLVIVYFVLNDVEPKASREGPKIEFHEDYLNTYQSADRMSDLSYVWSWGRYRFLKRVQAKRYIQNCVDSFNCDSTGWRACRDALHDIKAMCDPRGRGISSFRIYTSGLSHRRTAAIIGAQRRCVDRFRHQPRSVCGAL